MPFLHFIFAYLVLLISAQTINRILTYFGSKISNNSLPNSNKVLTGYRSAVDLMTKDQYLCMCTFIAPVICEWSLVHKMFDKVPNNKQLVDKVTNNKMYGNLIRVK